MIEDLDGATTEPSRRTHVALLSAATAAFAIVLFYALVAPPIFDGAPQAASPSPSRTSAMTVVSNPLINMPLDVTRSPGCSDATTWAPLRLAVDANSRPLFIVVYDQTGSRPIAFVREELGTGRLVFTCATPDHLAPRINRAR